MKHRAPLKVLFMIASIGVSVVVAQPISLSGTVKSSDGTPLGGAWVYLVNHGYGAGTNPNGEFSIKVETVDATQPLALNAVMSRPEFRIASGTLHFSLNTPVSQLKATAHDLAGRLIAQSNRHQLSAGSHSLALVSNHQAATQGMVITLWLDGSEQSVFVPANASANAAPLKKNLSAAVAQAAVAFDKLHIQMGSISKEIDISASQQNDIEVVLDYTPPTIPEPEPRTIDQQKDARKYLLNLKGNKSDTALYIGFRYQDDDSTKDVIGVVIATHAQKNGVVTDTDFKQLLNFPKLQAIWIQNQKLTDDGLKILEKFPHLIDIRLHYMDLKDPSTDKTLITKDFLLPVNVHRNLRVLEIKHNMQLSHMSVERLDGFPYLQRLVLDLGGAKDNGAQLIQRCPNLIDLHFHRATMSQIAFERAILAVPKLKLLWVRHDKVPVSENHLEILRNHPSLIYFRTDGVQDSLVDRAENFLMPLLTIPTFKQLFNVGLKNGTNPAVTKLIEAAKDQGRTIELKPSGGHVDFGYIFPPLTDLGDNSRATLKAFLDDKLKK
jgi:hypothetical protein